MLNALDVSCLYPSGTRREGSWGMDGTGATPYQGSKLVLGNSV